MAVSAAATPVLIVGLGAAAGSVLKALAAFGDNLTFHLILQLVSTLSAEHFYNVQEAVAILMPPNTLVLVVLTASTIADVDWWLARRILPAAAVGTVLGVQVLTHARPHALKVWIGALFLSFVAARAVGTLRAVLNGGLRGEAAAAQTSTEQYHDEAHDEIPQLEDRHHGVSTTTLAAHPSRHPGGSSDGAPAVATVLTATPGPIVHDQEQRPKPLRCWDDVAALLTGLSAGFLGGLYGLPGLTVKVYFIVYLRDKAVVRSTGMVLGLLNSSIAAVQLAAAGWVSTALWKYYLVFFAGAAIGSGAGWVLHNRVSSEAITQLIVTLVFITSVMAIADDDLARAAVLGAACLLAFALAMAIAKAVAVRRRSLGGNLISDDDGHDRAASNSSVVAPHLPLR